MSFDAIPHLLADVLQEQKTTNEVLTRLIETLAGLRTKAESAVKAAKQSKAVTAAPEAAPVVEVVPAVEAVTDTPAPAATPAPAITVALDYKADVAPTFAKLLAAKGAPAVVAVLNRFGVQKGVELAPAQLADALAAATAALAE